MSSFRIDRQYVAFETAETQPVYATSKAQKASPEPDDNNKALALDISKLYNEIYERLQNEHAEQAEYMLSKAAAEAQEIIDKAKKQADEAINQARQAADKMRDDLIREIESEAAQRKGREEAELKQLETKLRSDYAQLTDGMRSDVIGLVMEIVKKIIGIKLSQTDEVFMGMVRDALERLKQTGSALIRVCPQDYARYFGAERDDLGIDLGEMKISVIEEPGFTNGDLVVESEGEMIDLGISRQINQIEKAFKN